MKYTDLPKNGMGIILTLVDDGGIDATLIHNLNEDLDPEISQELLDVLNGLYVMVSSGYDIVGVMGSLLREVTELTEELECGSIVFEPDQELLDSVEKSKVIPFNKNKMN